MNEGTRTTHAGPVRSRALMLGVVVLAAIALVIGGGWFFWRWKLPLANAGDLAHLHARQVRHEARRALTKTRPPLRAPGIAEDGAGEIAAAIPDDVDALRLLDAAWPTAMNARPMGEPEQALLDDLAPRLPRVVRAVRGASRNEQRSRRGHSAHLAVHAMLLLAIERANTTGESCLSTAVEAMQIRADLPWANGNWEPPLRWIFERCTRLASPEERRVAAADLVHVLAHADHPGVDIDGSLLADLTMFLSQPPPEVYVRKPLLWLQHRAAFSAGVEAARHVLDRRPETLWAVEATCMPACAFALKADPATSAIEASAIDGIVRFFADEATQPRLIAAMVALAAGEPEAEVAVRFPDPGTGAPFGTTTIGDRRAIYYFGLDQHDDHGTDDDLVIRLPP